MNFATKSNSPRPNRFQNPGFLAASPLEVAILFDHFHINRLRSPHNIPSLSLDSVTRILELDVQGEDGSSSGTVNLDCLMTLKKAHSFSSLNSHLKAMVVFSSGSEEFLDVINNP